MCTCVGHVCRCVFVCVQARVPTWSPDVQPGVYLSADVGLLLNVCVSGCVSGNVGEARTGDTGT